VTDLYGDLLAAIEARENIAKKKPLDLTPYRGQWVSVKDGRVIGHARTASEIIDQMVMLSSAGRGSNMWFEEHPEDVNRWAVMSSAGRIGPNCYFKTEDEARRWIRSWTHIEDPGVLVTRVDQHEPWELVELVLPTSE
jgi:hypothetical protein